MSKYDSILELPHHVSDTRPQMLIADRAAQFAPFAALTGFDAAVSETGRLTDARPELDENEKSVINERLTQLCDRLDERPEAVITYFKPDARKEGGACITVTGRVGKIDALERLVLLTDGTRIRFDDLMAVE